MARIFWTFHIGVLAASLAAAEANACFAGYEFTMVFDEIPFGLEAPVIAKITVVEAPADPNKKGAVLLARIDKIIKGELEGEFVRLIYVLTSCGPAEPKSYVGASGIVLGTLESNDEGALYLRPVYDSANQFRQRVREQGRK